MNKLLKGILIVTMLVIGCVLFAGCGNKDSEKSLKSEKNEHEVEVVADDKIVASKHFDKGDYTEKMEVIFKDDKAFKYIITMEFKDESTAKSFKERLGKGANMENAEIEVLGSKIKIEMSAEDFCGEEGLEYNDENTTKEKVKQLFKDNGFSIDEE